MVFLDRKSPQLAAYLQRRVSFLLLLFFLYNLVSIIFYTFGSKDPEG